MISQSAPAKVNLYLHIGPLRRDGLHELASLFVFTEVGDVIEIKPADKLSLNVHGPFANALSDIRSHDNIVWRAAEILQREFNIEAGAEVTLVKNLPVAAGIGGGSADAAAALKALCGLWDINISADRLSKIAFRLGADVPACLSRRPVNVTGAGEVNLPGADLPPLWLCLVNPLIALATGEVFREFDRANIAPPPPRLSTLQPRDYAGVSALMDATRNDLEPVAISLRPLISDVLDLLKDRPDAIANRMSGSGATCFALFSSAGAARKAAKAAEARGWWALASKLAMG